MNWLADWPAGERRLVEFVGGPCDGYAEWVDAMLVHKNSSRIRISISQSLLSALCGVRYDRDDMPSSQAVYELGYIRGEWRFQFIGQQELKSSADSRRQ